MDRFHIVVSNYNNIAGFVNNFSKIKNFDRKLDKLYIFDCSPNNCVSQQIRLSKYLVTYGLVWNETLYFLRRRNWNFNHGAQLDYIRCLLGNTISPTKYTYFLQDHYLDTRSKVNADTIPGGNTVDLNSLARWFESDRHNGCAFISRQGIRICTSNPMKKEIVRFWGDEGVFKKYYADRYMHYRKKLSRDIILPDSLERCFCIDGGNFAVRTSFYLSWFSRNPKYLIAGDGSYGFCHVWESRLGQILYDQHIRWKDVVNNVSYRSIEELHALEARSRMRLAKYWYDNPVWYYYYGRDLVKYRTYPLIQLLWYLLRYYIPTFFISDRDTYVRSVQ